MGTNGNGRVIASTSVKKPWKGGGRSARIPSSTTGELTASKFTPERRECILEHIRKCVSLYAAAHAAGVSYRVFLKWRRRGEEELERGEDTVFGRFATEVDRAEADAEIGGIRQINTIGEREQDWKSFAWILERRFPERWGRAQSSTTVNVQANTTIQNNTFEAESIEEKQLRLNETAKLMIELAPHIPVPVEDIDVPDDE